MVPLKVLSFTKSCPILEFSSAWEIESDLALGSANEMALFFTEGDFFYPEREKERERKVREKGGGEWGEGIEAHHKGRVLVVGPELVLVVAAVGWQNSLLGSFNL